VGSTSLATLARNARSGTDAVVNRWPPTPLHPAVQIVIRACDNTLATSERPWDEPRLPRPPLEPGEIEDVGSAPGQREQPVGLE
jgi:hypothetical protein